jgi:hypothetical protein
LDRSSPFIAGTVGILLMLFLGSIYSLALGYNYRYIIFQLAKIEHLLDAKSAVLQGWPKSRNEFLDRYRLTAWIPWCTPPAIIQVFWYAFLAGIVWVTVSASVVKPGAVNVLGPIGIACLLIGWLVWPIRLGYKLKRLCDKEPAEWPLDSDSATNATNQLNKPELFFGFREEWQDFHKRHLRFLERFPHLKDALDTAFIRTAHLAEPIDRFIFLYGRLCSEDFFEVLLLSGNGYGQAAQKVVRGLYERAVTLRYLHDNPGALEDFWDFHHISQYKLMLSIKETMGDDVFPDNISGDVEQKYKDLKERFMVTDCKKCGTKRLNHTWSKLDFVAMAKKTGALGQLIVPGYYIPLRQAHSTVASMLSRLEESETGGISFDPSAQRDAADDALMTAHNVLLGVLEVQDEHFKLPGLHEKIQTCLQDFLDIYRKDSTKVT